MLPDNWQWVPFIGLALQPTGGHTPFMTRLIESGIIGAIILFGTVQVLGERIDGLSTVIHSQQASQDKRIERLENLHIKSGS